MSGRIDNKVTCTNEVSEEWASQAGGYGDESEFFRRRQSRSSIVESTEHEWQRERPRRASWRWRTCAVRRGKTRMGKAYRHPAMKQLKDQQTRYAPRERRLEQVERGRASFLARSRGRSVTRTSILCYRITGFRPDGWPALVLEGGDVQHDLRMFVEDLSATARQAVEQVEEPVLTVDEVSRRYNVSSRTVARWRRQGLVARRFVIGGRTKVGFLESSLQRFVTAHHAQVERGSRFRQLTEAERDEIIRRARRMALVRPGQAGLVEIARRIARKMSRSTETIRLTLKAYDRDHPDRAIFPNALPPLDD